MAKGGIKGPPPDDDGGSNTGNGEITLTSGDDVWPDGADNSGDDVVRAGDGNDIVDGGDGNDSLNGQGGDDILSGGAGDDFFLSSAGNDTIDGGDGFDRYSYNPSDQVYVNFADTAFDVFGDGSLILPANSVLDGNGIIFKDDQGIIIIGEGGDLDSVINVEWVSGTSGNDVMNGSEGADRFGGGRGDDTLYGNGGDDTLNGDRGNDTIVGGAGSDTMSGGSQSDIFIFNGEDFDGGEVDTIIDYNASADTLVLNGLTITNIETGVSVGGSGKKDSILTVENGDGDVGQIILYDIAFDPNEAAFAGGTDADDFFF